ncbi:hypothetical protein A2U01_0102920, partial [Trifolium medium]|nr:hypothetical protein [Trifolium medium]
EKQHFHQYSVDCSSVVGTSSSPGAAELIVPGTADAGASCVPTC